MSSTSHIIRIAPIPETPPKCTPNLMPFHIAYSGPAPVSTYFRVKSAPPPSYGKESEDSHKADTPSQEDSPSADSQTTLIATSSSVTLDSPATLSTSVAAASGTNGAASLAKRFIAAFRGRTVQGVAVDLPENYVGLVLRTPLAGKQSGPDSRKNEEERTREKAKHKAGKRPSRRSAHVEEVDVGEDVSGDTSHAVTMEEQEASSRILQPTATFSSFVLWHQDTPVDEGSDEYLRSLREWTQLAAEVHSFD